MRYDRWWRLALLAAACLGNCLAAEPARKLDQPLATLVAQDARLARVGHRLATANTAICEMRAPSAAWALHALSQYTADQQAAARRLWNLDGRPAVAGIVPGGSAERAGVRAGDRVVAIDGNLFLSASGQGAASYRLMSATLDIVERALANGTARLTVERGGERIEVVLRGDIACAVRFEVATGGDVQARADGRYIQVESGLMQSTPDDAELAAAVAHELAHNLLCHRALLQARGIDPSRRRQTREAREAIRATEVQADLLSVTLMANAGYDVTAAARLWTRLARERRGASGTHPAAADRIAALTREAQRVAAFRDAGEPIPPPIEAAPSASSCPVSTSQR